MAVRKEPIRGGERDRERESEKGQPLTADVSLANELAEFAQCIQAVARTDRLPSSRFDSVVINL